MMQMRKVRPTVICLKNCDAYRINYLLCSVLFVFFDQRCLQGVDFSNNLGNVDENKKQPWMDADTL